MRAKEFLAQGGHEFREIDITKLEHPAATLRAITGGPIATPLIVIGDEHLLGFDPEWIAARLAK